MMQHSTAITPEWHDDALVPAAAHVTASGLELPVYISAKRVTEITPLSRSLLAKWRAEGIGPPWYKFCDSKTAPVYYKPDELLAFLESRRNEPTCL